MCYAKRKMKKFGLGNRNASKSDERELTLLMQLAYGKAGSKWGPSDAVLGVVHERHSGCTKLIITLLPVLTRNGRASRCT